MLYLCDRITLHARPTEPGAQKRQRKANVTAPRRRAKRHSLIFTWIDHTAQALYLRPDRWSPHGSATRGPTGHQFPRQVG